MMAQDCQVDYAKFCELRDEINRRAWLASGRFAGNFPRTHLSW